MTSKSTEHDKDSLTGKIRGIRDWVDFRLPIMTAYRKHLSEYYAPKNFNIWYLFGVFSMVVLVIQLLTGIWLTMNYTPSAEAAFASVEYIMRDVDYGWILRYMHSTGASAFFFVIYVHMFRGMMYGSYKKPRELIWIFGMAIYLVLMAEGFFGLCLALGADVILGRERNCFVIWGNSHHRRRSACLD
jgi:ubiquinol-cytochrome c reductase cytochrome b subunit